MQNGIRSEPANFDEKLFCSAAKALGTSRLAALLAVFEARIEWLAAAFIAVPTNYAGILATLHQSRGSAATLGFIALERVLADIEMRLSPPAGEPACGSSGVLAPGIGAPALPHQAAAAIGEAWQASLTAASLYVPDLRHHRPFGSKR